MTRRGFTLIEVLIVIGLVGVMAAFAVPRIGRTLARQSVRSARGAVETLHSKARAISIQRGRRAALVFNGDVAVIVSRHPVTGAVDTIGNPEDLHSRYGVTCTTSRDTLLFDPRGVGMESGNTTISVQKGPYVEGIVISSLGRVLR